MSIIIFEGLRHKDDLPSRIALRSSSVIDLAEFPEQEGCVVRYRTGHPGTGGTEIATAFLKHPLGEVVDALNKTESWL